LECIFVSFLFIFLLNYQLHFRHCAYARGPHDKLEGSEA